MNDSQLNNIGEFIQTKAGVALFRQCKKSRNPLVFIHGAGLEPTHPLYISFLKEASELVSVFIPFLRAIHFLSFPKGFRKPSGWSVHRHEMVNKEIINWNNLICSLEYENILWGGGTVGVR